MFGLDGKKIALLGGGDGMGEATARLISSWGAAVAVVDKVPERAERVAKALPGSKPFEIDLLQDAALVDGMARIERDFGPLDGMVSVVGFAGWKLLVDMTNEEWDLDHSRNLRYFFIASRELARSLLKRQAGGSIVGVASVDGIRSAPNHAAYGAAKAGLMNLAKSMAAEWSGQGIRVNLVAPGAIITPRFPHSGEENERKMMHVVPMARRGTVDDIAKAAAFFLSDLSPYVTGQTLAVDGGFDAANVFNLVQTLPGTETN